MTRLDPSTEPARQTPYRRLYGHIYKLKDEIARQDGVNGYLLNEIRALQKRVEQLEKHNADVVSRKLKAAYESVDELDERGDLPVQEARGPTVGRPAACDGC